MNRILLIILFTAAAIMSRGHAAQLEVDPEIAEGIRLSLLVEETTPNDFDLEKTLMASQQHFSDVSKETIVIRRSALDDLHKRFQEAKKIGMTKDVRNAFRRERSDILHTHVLDNESEIFGIIWSMDQEFANSLDSSHFKTKDEFNKAFDSFWEARLSVQLSVAQNDSFLRILLLEDATIEREQMRQDFEEDIELISKAEEAEHKRLADEESKQVVTEREAYRKRVQEALSTFKCTLQNESFEGFIKYLERQSIPTQVYDDILLGIWEKWITDFSVPQVQTVNPVSVSTINSHPLSAKEAARLHWAKK